MKEMINLGLISSFLCVVLLCTNLSNFIQLIFTFHNSLLKLIHFSAKTKIMNDLRTIPPRYWSGCEILNVDSLLCFNSCNISERTDGTVVLPKYISRLASRKLLSKYCQMITHPLGLFFTLCYLFLVTFTSFCSLVFSVVSY